MREKIRIANSGTIAWIGSGEVELDANDLAATLGQHASDQRLIHRVDFAPDQKPPATPIVKPWVSGWRVRGLGPQYRVNVNNVSRDGFNLVVGKEGGSSFGYLAVSWLAFSPAAEKEAA